MTQKESEHFPNGKRPALTSQQQSLQRMIDMQKAQHVQLQFQHSSAYSTTNYSSLETSLLANSGDTVVNGNRTSYRDNTNTHDSHLLNNTSSTNDLYDHIDRAYSSTATNSDSKHAQSFEHDRIIVDEPNYEPNGEQPTRLGIDFTSLSGPEFQFPERQNSFMRQSVGVSVTQDSNNVDMLQHAHDRIEKHSVTPYQHQSNRRIQSKKTDTPDIPQHPPQQEYNERLSAHQFRPDNASELSLDRAHYNYASSSKFSDQFHHAASVNNSKSENCVTSFFKADNLHRSFCFGAIDGMLTGSGITAACVGLGFINTTSSVTTNSTVVALSLAACSSDAICMAIGHLWSTYVLHNATSQEMEKETLNFTVNRADAKAKLLDMLLSRGMLKIDAMSVVDTLEGYPDIFVSALMGGATGQTFGSSSTGEDMVQGYGSSRSALGLASKIRGSYGSLGSGSLLNPEDGDFSHGHYPIQPPYINQSVDDRRGLKSAFEGSYNEQFDEFGDHSERHILKLTMKNSLNEGLSIMLAFCLFSVLPSLIYISVLKFLPCRHPPTQSYSFSNDNLTEDRSVSPISPISVSVTCGSLIMLLLGIWKSSFFQSNWVVFGIETVLVLYFCLFSAYVIGFCLSNVI